MAKGVCKLTGKPGKFVDAHIFPKAFLPSEGGMPFIQAGARSRPVRRWTSWYDDSLVTQAGEDILAALDNWAIPQLRRHKLVWSGWGPMQSLGDTHDVIVEHYLGVRQVQNVDPKRLRLFFLSLLWRAAASDRREFSHIKLPTDHLEQLRQMLLMGNAEPLSFYPILLTQLSTMGPAHQLAPLADTKVVREFEGHPENSIPIFRFFFDGLIAHVHRQASDNGLAEELGPLVVGASDKLTLSTITYERSLQRETLERVMAEARELWPDVLSRL